jgi:hypothetical protein
LNEKVSKFQVDNNCNPNVGGVAFEEVPIDEIIPMIDVAYCTLGD